MDNVIAFPGARPEGAVHGAAVSRPTATDPAGSLARQPLRSGVGPDPSTPDVRAAAEPIAMLSAEIRRVPRGDSRMGPDVAGRVMNRCLVAALDALSAAGADIELSGTPARPTLDATFRGPDPAHRAATAAQEVRGAIRIVQRQAEDEFHVFGAIALGGLVARGDRTTVLIGAPDGIATRLRELAAPDQFLLLADTAIELGDAFETAPGGATVDLPGRPGAVLHVLRPVRLE